MTETGQQQKLATLSKGESTAMSSSLTLSPSALRPGLGFLKAHVINLPAEAVHLSGRQ